MQLSVKEERVNVIMLYGFPRQQVLLIAKDSNRFPFPLEERTN